MSGLNWYLTLRNLAKTDEVAAELFEQLQKAETDEEKDSAKQAAQNYINQTKESNNNPSESETTEETVVEESENSDSGCDSVDSIDNTVSCDEPDVPQSTERSQEITDEEKIKQDLSQPAFNPRLAKCGITREEELFLAGTYVRKLNHEEKILMRRSIYQKKNMRQAQIQAEYKAKRIAQREKDLNDPEKIKFHQERKLMSAVVEALVNHKNMIYLFSQIEGLTPDILKELLKSPGNRNAVYQANPRFLENFKKAYGD